LPVHARQKKRLSKLKRLLPLDSVNTNEQSLQDKDMKKLTSDFGFLGGDGAGNSDQRVPVGNHRSVGA